MLKSHLARAGKWVAWTCITLTAMSILAFGIGRIYGYELLSVQSDSMRPSINPGDAVLISTKPVVIKAGQVISYHSVRDSRVINTHRVLDVNARQGSLITKGDNLVVSDTNIPMANVIGTVSGNIPYAGYLLDMFRRPIGLTVGLYVPMLMIVAAEIRSLSRYYSVYYPRHYVLYR
jgi:signal peptidase I